MQATHSVGPGRVTTVHRLLFSLADAADQLSVSQRVLERLIRDGEVESVLLGRRRLVPHDALTDYIDRLRAAS